MPFVDLDEIAGAKATHRFARLSASKARAVLELIRDEDLEDARDELQFCERGAADVVSKVLESAVANAENNEHLDPTELYVAEAWADEGPTLKRWRPRARGRATRINKQTCHITVVVAQLSAEELEVREERRERSGVQTAAAARAARVAASRAAQDDEDALADEDVTDVADVADEELTDEAVTDAPVDDASDEAAEDTDEGPHGAGSVAPPEDGSIPEGYEIKGNVDSMKFHEPGGTWYEQTVAEVYFATAEDARAAGFAEAGSGDDEAVDDGTED